jgi:hypothetical protein
LFFNHFFSWKSFSSDPIPNSQQPSNRHETHGRIDRRSKGRLQSAICGSATSPHRDSPTWSNTILTPPPLTVRHHATHKTRLLRDRYHAMLLFSVPRLFEGGTHRYHASTDTSSPARGPLLPDTSAGSISRSRSRSTTPPGNGPPLAARSPAGLAHPWFSAAVSYPPHSSRLTLLYRFVLSAHLCFALPWLPCVPLSVRRDQ